MGASGRVAAVLVIATSFATCNALYAVADQYVQIGANSTDVVQGEHLRTTLSSPAPAPNYPSGNPDKFYWVGTTFSSGVSFQVGYRDAARHTDCATLQWFVAAFNSIGEMTLYTKGGCGTSGTKSFMIAKTGTNPNTGYAIWSGHMNGSPLPGTAYQTYSSKVAANRSVVVSEVSTTGSFGGDPGLAAATYSPAMQLMVSGSWHAPGNGRVYRANGGSYYTPCPPYYISDLGTNAVRPHSNTAGTCFANGVVLW